MPSLTPSSQCIVGYSIQNGACLNVIFFTFDPAQEHGVHPGEWMRKAAKAEFAGAFEGWEPEVQAMLDVGGVDVCKPLDARARRRRDARARRVEAGLRTRLMRDNSAWTAR